MDRNKKPAIEVESRIVDPDEVLATKARLKAAEDQRAVFQKLIDDEVLTAETLGLLIELGFVVTVENVQPCDDVQRAEEWWNFDKAVDAYMDRKVNPAPHPDELGRPLGFTEYHQQLQLHFNYPPRLGMVRCPLAGDAWGADKPLPCSKARAMQVEFQKWREDHAEWRHAIEDPQDPVNLHQMRPCVVLGDILADAVLVPIYCKRRQAENPPPSRWPVVKPRA